MINEPQRAIHATEEARERVLSTVAGIGSYITATADLTREDRLWPSSFEVFDTNPMSLAYGAAGIGMFLARSGTGVPPSAVDWMKQRELNTDDYPPGFFIGLAGIAYALAEMGRVDDAEHAMRLCYRSPLRDVNPTMFNGVAGWGYVSLFLHEATGRQEYLDRAADAADFLLNTSETVDDVRRWPIPGDEAVHLGYGYGASGIALFLLAVGQATGRGAYVEAATQGLEHDLARRVEDEYGWSWPATEGTNVVQPYWGRGASGIGAVAIRFHAALGDVRFLKIAEQVAVSTYCKWTINPCLLSGLSGVAEYLLDMHVATGRSAYLEQAYDLAETLLLYRLCRDEGIAFPDRWLARICTDVAAGSSGIGLFLHRLADPGGRALVDLSESVSILRDSALRGPGAARA